MSSLPYPINPSLSQRQRTAAVVVTHNRKESVVEVIEALLNQTASCDIVIVDNASSDGTANVLEERGFLARKNVHYFVLPENLGGSGGFFSGLHYAIERDWHWFWLMDDDAVPEPDALEHLLKYADRPDTVYGSAAVNENNGKTKLCWPAIIRNGGRKRFVEFPELLAEAEKVDMIPFLGFLIHRRLIERVGYPDRGFFICADDKEYCERIKRHNANLILIRSSIIHHPLAQVRIHRFGRFQAAYRSLPPWKIYYDIRNKILIAKAYFGHRLWTQTLPGIFGRAFLQLLNEKPFFPTLKMTLKAVFDGLRNRKGKIVCPPG